MAVISDGAAGVLVVAATCAVCRERTVMRWEDAYCKLLPGADPVTYVRHEPTDCRAYVAVFPKRRSIVVAFSGSASVQNFKVRPVAGPSGSLSAATCCVVLQSPKEEGGISFSRGGVAMLRLGS